MPREKRVDALILGEEPEPVEINKGYSPTGPAPRQVPISEKREPAFYRMHYQTPSGSVHIVWRIADCEKHAIDTCLSLGTVIRIKKFLTRKEVLDALSPGRGIRCVFTPADLELGRKHKLLLSTDY